MPTLERAARVAAWLALAASVAWVTPACTAGGPGGDDGDGMDHGRFGLVVLTRAGAAGAGEEFTAQAWFAEHSGVPADQILRFLNVPLLADGVPEEADQCRVTRRQLKSLPPTADGISGWVDFVDAGPLAVETGRWDLDVRTKLLPDLGLGMGGVVYDTRLRDGEADETPEPWRVEGAGGSQVGAFRAAAQAPEPLRFIAVGPNEVTGPSARWPGDGRAEGLDVSWEAAEDGHGVVILELVRHGFDRATSVICAAVDDGHFRVPASLVAQLPNYGEDQTDRLELLRYGAGTFTADGLDEGLVLAVSRAAVRLE